MYIVHTWETLNKENRCVHACDSLVRQRRTSHCTDRGISAAAYAAPFTDDRLPKKVEQQTTSALFTRRATLRPHCPAVKRLRFAFYAYSLARAVAARASLVFCISLYLHLHLHIPRIIMNQYIRFL